MSWSEIETAKAERRHELVLSGGAVSERLAKGGLPPSIFQVTTLNYLNIHETVLEGVPDSISELVNLQTLVLHSNKISKITTAISKLDKLKVLDLSRNSLEEIPEEFAKLLQLTTLNVSSNRLVKFPKLQSNVKLQVLDLANNKLATFPDVCYPELSSLTDVKVNGNEIEEISGDIKNLTALKNFDVSNNKIKALPGELIECSKLKEINLKQNPITDRRLFKLIDQCRTKQIMDYVRQHCKTGDAKSSKKSGKKGKRDSETVSDEDTRFKIIVQHCSDETLKIILREEVKKVRGFIQACLVHGLNFEGDKYKRFIQLQTKLHDGICEKRNAATIATHDASKICGGNLTYTAQPPRELKIKPLNRNSAMTGEELFGRLQAEAENLRKEKKRNVYSGIHKYLYLLEGQKMYPSLLNAENVVISFPPITNSDVTKISAETKSILVEVTSAASQNICKQVLDAFIRDTVLLLEQDVTVEQVKNTDLDGNFKSVYPSKTDLVYEDNAVVIVRE